MNIIIVNEDFNDRILTQQTKIS